VAGAFRVGIELLPVVVKNEIFAIENFASILLLLNPRTLAPTS
jgi:hypothetical protein